ncbi:GAF domain protein [Minicystis rosea]|nr:GAF domain protein [Minicystis rosea]
MCRRDASHASARALPSSRAVSRERFHLGARAREIPRTRSRLLASTVLVRLETTPTSRALRAEARWHGDCGGGAPIIDGFVRRRNEKDMWNRTPLKAPDYVGQIREDTQRCLRELLDDNAKLRALVGDLERENARLRDAAVAPVQDDRHVDVRQIRLFKIEAEGRRLAERSAAVAKQTADLANLHIALRRLHATLERERVVTAIHEIVTHLLGCEEFALFDVSPNGSLSPASSCGVDPHYLQQLCVEDGIVGDVVLHGETFLNEAVPRTLGPGGELPITACVPMRIESTFLGVLVLFRMRAQKTSIEPIDREILDLLATHATSALYATRCYAKEMPTRRPRACVS